MWAFGDQQLGRIWARYTIELSLCVSNCRHFFGIFGVAAFCSIDFGQL